MTRQFGYNGVLFHWQHSLPVKNRVLLLLFPSQSVSHGRDTFIR
jgi:hypothetical protein